MTIQYEIIRTSMRNRECIRCERKIVVGEKYVNKLVRYDNRRFTLNYHLECHEQFLGDNDAEIMYKQVKSIN